MSRGDKDATTYGEPRQLSRMCAYCQQPRCNMRCSCCEDFYCGVECQRHDFKAHEARHRNTALEISSDSAVGMVLPGQQPTTSPRDTKTPQKIAFRPEATVRPEHATALLFSGNDGGKPGSAVAMLYALRRLNCKISEKQTAPLTSMFDGVAGFGSGAIAACAFSATDSIDMAVVQFAAYSDEIFNDTHKNPDDTFARNIPRDDGLVDAAEKDEVDRLLDPDIATAFVPDGLTDVAAVVMSSGEKTGHKVPLTVIARNAKTGEVVTQEKTHLSDPSASLAAAEHLIGSLSVPGWFPPHPLPQKEEQPGEQDDDDYPKVMLDALGTGEKAWMAAAKKFAMNITARTKKTTVDMIYLRTKLVDQDMVSRLRRELALKPREYHVDAMSGSVITHLNIHEVILYVGLPSIDSGRGTEPVRVAFHEADQISQCTGLRVLEVSGSGHRYNADMAALVQYSEGVLLSTFETLFGSASEAKPSKSRGNVRVTLNKKDAQKPFELTASMKQYLESDLAPREHPESINDEASEAAIGNPISTPLVVAWKLLEMGTSKTWQWIKSRFEWAHIWDTAFYVTGAAVMIYFFYWQTIEATFMDILHASSFVNILSFRAMWPYLKSGASMLSYINYGGTMASTVGRVGKVGVQILYRNTVQNSVVTTWRRIDPKREGSHREIGGDANVIAKWAYLLDASGNEAKATSVLADTFRRVNSVWRPLGDRRRPEIESEIEKHANIKTSSPLKSIEDHYQNMFRYYGCTKTVLEKLENQPILKEIFLRELAETSPLVQYDVATEPGMRSVIEKSTRDGETPQLGWGSNCSWEFNNHVIPLIDGNSAFSSMAKAIRDAKSCVYIAGWSITLGLPMERDKYGGNTTLGDLLIRCADRGVDVYLMAWRGSALSVGSELLEPWKTSLSDKHRKHIFIATPTNPEMGKMKDVSSMSHHQKIVVIDDMCAFIGGLDVTTNRWDLNSHPCLARLSENARLRSKKSASLMVKLNMDSRFTGFDYYSPSLDDLDAHTFLKKFKRSAGGRITTTTKISDLADMFVADAYKVDDWPSYRRRALVMSATVSTMMPMDLPDIPRMGWHDMSLQLYGPVVRQVYGAFERRWIKAETGVKLKSPVRTVTAPPTACLYPCLITQSIPMQNRDFSERSIKHAYISAIACAKEFVYIEQQYFSVFMNWSDAVRDKSKYDMDAISAAYVDVFGKDNIMEAMREHLDESDKLRRRVPAIVEDPGYEFFSNVGGFKYDDIIRAGGTASHIGSVLAWRLRTAVLEGERFAVRVVVPAYPDGFGAPETFDARSDATTADKGARFTLLKKLLMLTMALQYLSTAYLHRIVVDALAQRSRSKKPVPDTAFKTPEEYFQVYCLRSVSRATDGFPVTEQIYPHIKCLITDKLVINGSANLNERSMSGYRDTEIAAVVASSKFARSLLHKLISEHTDHASNIWTTDDPGKLVLLNKRAKLNTSAFVAAFEESIPEANVSSTAKYKKKCEDYKAAHAAHTKIYKTKRAYETTCDECDILTAAQEAAAEKCRDTKLDATACAEMAILKEDKDTKKEEHAALATKERSVGLPLAKRLQFLKNVRGHITVAPRTWMKDDLILIRGSQNVSVVREKAANGLEMEISGNMVTSTAFDVQVTMLDVVQ